MLKLPLFPIAICLCMSILAGCSQTEIQEIPVVSPEPLFCDVEEPRRFSQEELNWRAEHAPWNLRRDFNTNKAWDAECSQESSQETQE